VGKKNKNPLPPEDRKIDRIEPELETDNFSAIEQKKIVKFILEDAISNAKVMADALSQARKDVDHYECENPSKLENMNIQGWQSDRNFGLCPAVADTYQATLFATCYNPDSLHMIATEKNDIDTTDSLTRFAKWMVGPQEVRAQQEVDDFIHNRITLGFSVFYIWWKVYYEWVDKRIPKKKGGYTIKTEKMRFEKGVLENIADPFEDLLLPKFGKNFQDLKQFIHIIHMSGSEVEDAGDRGLFVNVDDKMIKAVKDGRNNLLSAKETSARKKFYLGITDVSDHEVSDFPMDMLCWYGYYKKNGKRERYRFIIEPITERFFAGKPLRKITRTGKVPFVGGAFIRRPGFIIGKSLVRLIAPIVNAFNVVFNQIIDFQFISNVPFGFFKPDEEHQQSEYKLVPGVLFPSDDPNNVNFPNLTRSNAWSQQIIQVLFDVLEKLTGAAAYFMSTQQNASGTATRDRIVEEKSETRFGIWVNRIQLDISEAITFVLQMYQDWAPPKLGERVLGEDGKQLFKNLSVRSLQGQYDARMKPDVVAGSKNLDKQIKMWGVENLSQSPWLQPQINPKGNYNLWADAAKAIGFTDVERYLGPEPPAQVGTSDVIEDEFTRMAQGEAVELIEGENPVEHYYGHMTQKEEKYYDMDEEYRPIFDRHLFATQMNYQKYMQDMMQEQMANKMAMSMVQKNDQGLPNDVGLMK